MISMRLRKLLSPQSLSIGLALFLVALLMFLRCIIAWKTKTTLSVDEGYFGAFALGLDGGRALPYVDAVSQRGPVLYWLIFLFQKLGGLYSWSGIHWLSVAAAVTTTVALFLAGHWANRAFAGALASLVSAVLTTVVVPMSDGIALNGEVVAAAFLTTAMALQAASARRPTLLLFLAGCCVSLAALSKQTAAFAAPGFLAWAVFSARSRAHVLSYLSGLATPVVSVLCLYALRGAMADLFYWTVTYNRGIYLAPWKGEGLAEMVEKFFYTSDFFGWVATMRLMLVLMLSVALARPLSSLFPISRQSLGRLFSENGLELTAVFTAAATFWAALLTRRHWPHYFILPLPFLAFVFALQVDKAMQSVKEARTVPLTVTAVMAMYSLVGMGRLWNSVGREDWGRRHENAICTAIANSSKSGDSIFVWGFDGDLYVDCKRAPASRYVFASMLAGIVPGEWKTSRKEWVAPGTRKILANELRARKPKLLIEIPGSLGNTKLSSVDELERILPNYCEVGSVKDGGRRARIFKLRGPLDKMEDKRCAAESSPGR